MKDRPDLIAKCVPTYPLYGKRILLDNNWFKTLTKANVELVTDGIDHFDCDGIVTADGKLRPADIIVTATGFKVTEMAARLNITGREDKNLRDDWPATIRPPSSASPCRTSRTSSACSARIQGPPTAAA